MSWDVQVLFKLLAGALDHSRSIGLGANICTCICVDVPNRKQLTERVLAQLVVRKVDNAIHPINHYPADSVVYFVNTYPLDSNLSSG